MLEWFRKTWSPNHVFSQEHKQDRDISTNDTDDTISNTPLLTAQNSGKRSCFATHQKQRIIRVSYKSQQIELIRIAYKPDGKNNSIYNGTYVFLNDYQNKIGKDKQLDSSAYPKDHIFFLKMFPNSEKMSVEGFCEALLGKIINGMIDHEFIEPQYAKCFSPAETVTVYCRNNNEEASYRNVGAGLFQPYIQNAKALFKLANPHQKKKNVLSEVWNRVINKKGYEEYFERIEGGIDKSTDDMSYIIMIMLLFGNYSLHSGNILVTEAGCTITDGGAAFRKIIQTWAYKDIWQSLEEHTEYFVQYPIMKFLYGKLQELYWLHKQYIQFYMRIPGLFDKVAARADHLWGRISYISEKDIINKLAVFKNIIINAVVETYEVYKNIMITNHSAEHWRKDARIKLLQYIYGDEYSYIEARIQKEKTFVARSRCAPETLDYIRENRLYFAPLQELFLENSKIPVKQITAHYLAHHMLEVILTRLLMLMGDQSKIPKTFSTASPKITVGVLTYNCGNENVTKEAPILLQKELDRMGTDIAFVCFPESKVTWRHGESLSERVAKSGRGSVDDTRHGDYVILQHGYIYTPTHLENCLNLLRWSRLDVAIFYRRDRFASDALIATPFAICTSWNSKKLPFNWDRKGGLFSTLTLRGPYDDFQINFIGMHLDSKDNVAGAQQAAMLLVNATQNSTSNRITIMAGDFNVRIATENCRDIEPHEIDQFLSNITVPIKQSYDRWKSTQPNLRQLKIATSIEPTYCKRRKNGAIFFNKKRGMLEVGCLDAIAQIQPEESSAMVQQNDAYLTILSPKYKGSNRDQSDHKGVSMGYSVSLPMTHYACSNRSLIFSPNTNKTEPASIELSNHFSIGDV